MAKRKKAKKRVTKRRAKTERTSSSAPNTANGPKTEERPDRYKQLRHILSVIGKQLGEAQEATTKGKKHEHLNAAIVGSETLWQNLRALSREI
jgi:hypothetical protein